VRPPSRIGQAILSPVAGALYVVVSDPWLEERWGEWRHDVVAFAAGSWHRFSRSEDTVAELMDVRGWTRLA